MLRAIVAVIVGDLALIAMLFVMFTSAYIALGAERSFDSLSYHVSGLWLALSVAINLAAPIVGGWVCATIARSSKPPRVLAALVFVLTLAHGITSLVSPPADPGPRVGDVDNFEAMTRAVVPAWFEFVNAIVGPIGVLIGARLRGRS